MKKLSLIVSIVALLAVPAGCDSGSSSDSGSDNTTEGGTPDFTTGSGGGLTGPDLGALDQDGDGAVNADEWATSGEAGSFEELDANGDGLLTEDELPEAGCTPDCLGQTCGDDGCGGSCGQCLAGTSCSAAGVCEEGDGGAGGGLEGGGTGGGT